VSRRRLRLVLETRAGTEEVIVSSSSVGWSIERSGRKTPLDVAVLPDGRVSLVLDDGRQVCGRMVPGDGGVLVTTRVGTARVSIEDPIRHRLAAAEAESGGGGEEVRALMPGRVLEVNVAAGEAVPAGAVLLVLEAMKMQNEIRASRPGVVTEVAVKAGQAVDGGVLMVVLTEAPADT
jgi:biotin carboxyl carrier protein